MSKELTEEKLVSKLEEWFEIIGEYNEEEDRQAINQLKEIVEEHFKYDYLRNDPECRSIDEILEEKARQQKPTVTRAEVISLAADIHFEVQKGEYCSLDVDSAIWEFLQKKGVVEK